MELQKNFLYAAACMLTGLCSCSSTENLTSHYPYLSHLRNTECLNSRAIDDEESNDRDTYFEMKITDNTAECLFKSLMYPCDFEKVMVDVAYNDEIMTIVVYPASGGMADCLCEVDTNFSIGDLPEGSFVLKIYSGNTEGEYNKDYPIITETIKVKNGIVKLQL